jgi:hypothetical protein
MFIRTDFNAPLIQKLKIAFLYLIEVIACNALKFD